MKYRIGLDIGIGSVGWAVVFLEEAGHPAKLEDFGVRIFQSGEHPKDSKTLCSIRREDRGVRRLERRCAYRKKILKNHFQNIGLIGDRFYDELAACKDADVFALKVKGLDEKLTAAELYRCMIHTCNHRGYKDFYDPNPEDKDAGMLESAANAFEKSFKESNLRTVSEYLLSAKMENGFVKFRNREGENHTLIRRDLLRAEAAAILTKQAEYYPCLRGGNVNSAIEIIFAQRDFEDGPGDPKDPTRRYHGFLETLGKCPFYKDEDRGFRGTVLADIFAVTNALSQYRYVDRATGEFCLDKTIAGEMIEHLLQNASINITAVKKILKKHNFELQTAAGTDTDALKKAVKYLPLAKAAAEEAGADWNAMISDYLAMLSERSFCVDEKALLHRIGKLLSTCQTPSRRKNEMKADGIDEALIGAFSKKKLSGTASVSYHYMCDAINAFLSGDIYGNFQANRLKEKKAAEPTQKFMKLLPTHIDDPDVRNNRTVFKSINETRKIVNAIIECYGSPEEIVVEVASELGKSFEQRKKVNDYQKKREDATKADKKKIAELLKLKSPEDVTPSMLDRYRLFVEQEGKSLYSDRDLTENVSGGMAAVIRNRNHEYEVDHIVPYSLILDNTLENKVLVFASENQKKGQRAPLDYLPESEQADFKKRVNHLYAKKDGISKKKMDYLLLTSIYGKDAEEKLGQWKTRNINDTRYITKYICGLFREYLLFSGDKKQHVNPVKGSVTQRFRREWFRDTEWGDAEKNRDNYLHHALDAVICANLTRAYIEIGSDAMRLISIFKYHKRKYTPEYQNYLDACVEKMKKHYGFREEYTRQLLAYVKKVPTYVPQLKKEVLCRFTDKVIVSQKPERKFRGEIADAKPIRIEEIDGKPHKIVRESISKITEKNIDKLRTDDTALVALLKSIVEKYGSIEKYMSENKLAVFLDSNGKTVRKVTLDAGVYTKYYRVQKEDGNFANINSPGYYCVDVYQDEAGDTHIWGIRYVDIVKQNGKLHIKRESVPADYHKHVLYLFHNDYFKVFAKTGKLKSEGYYKGVKNINQSYLCCQKAISSERKYPQITKGDTVKKYDVSLLGQLRGEIGGEQKCSEPFPLTAEKK